MAGPIFIPRMGNATNSQYATIYMGKYRGNHLVTIVYQLMIRNVIIDDFRGQHVDHETVGSIIGRAMKKRGCEKYSDVNGAYVENGKVMRADKIPYEEMMSFKQGLEDALD